MLCLLLPLNLISVLGLDQQAAFVQASHPCHRQPANQRKLLNCTVGHIQVSSLFLSHIDYTKCDAQVHEEAS